MTEAAKPTNETCVTPTRITLQDQVPPLSVTSSFQQGETWYTMARPSREIAFRNRYLPEYGGVIPSAPKSDREKASIWPYQRVVTEVYSPKGVRDSSSVPEIPQMLDSRLQEYKYRYLLDYPKYFPTNVSRYSRTELEQRTPFIMRPYSNFYTVERDSTERYTPVALVGSSRTEAINATNDSVTCASVEATPVRVTETSAPRPYLREARNIHDTRRPIQPMYLHEGGQYRSCAEAHAFTESPYRYEVVAPDAPNETRVVATGTYSERPLRYDRYFPAFFPYYNSRVMTSVSTSTPTDLPPQ